MVNDASLLRSHQPISVEITTANNEELRCDTKGEAVLINHAGKQFLLRDVLFLPALTCNLLSVKKASEAGLNINFACDTISFKLPGRQALLTGKGLVQKQWHSMPTNLGLLTSKKLAQLND
jgi:hypothetical protein